MVKLYLRAIKNGTMAAGDVPALWRGQVQAALEAEGVDGAAEEGRDALEG